MPERDRPGASPDRPRPEERTGGNGGISTDEELAALFRAAPGGPPPPGFTLTDVTRASARSSARRRSIVLAAAVCVVALLAGGGIAGVTYFRGPETRTAQPVLAPARPNGPRAESTSGCDKVDRELATALAGELPATGTTGPSPGRVCTTDSRSAGFHVTDGDRSGFVSVTVFSSAPPTPPSDGSAAAQQAAAGGGSLLVLSTPDPGSAAPLEPQLARIAAALAGRF